MMEDQDDEQILNYWMEKTFKRSICDFEFLEEL